MHTASVQQSFPRRLSALDLVFDFVRSFVATCAIDDSDAFAMNLIVEEVFTNAVKYNPRDEDDVLLFLQRDGDQVTITLIDSGAQPFDPTNAPQADVHQSVEERNVGGLGLHLMRELADDIRYEYKNGISMITFIKRLGSRDV